MGTQLPPTERCTAAPTFQPMYCGQMAGWTRIPLGTEVGLGPGDTVLDWDSAPPPPKGAQKPPSHFLADVCCGQMVAHVSNCCALVFSFIVICR